MCTTLARSVLSIQGYLSSRHPIVKLLWANLSQSYTAAVVLCHGLIAAPSDAEREDAVSAVNEAISALLRIADRDPTALGCAQILQALLRHEQKVYSKHPRTHTVETQAHSGISKQQELPLSAISRSAYHQVQNRDGGGSSNESDVDWCRSLVTQNLSSKDPLKRNHFHNLCDELSTILTATAPRVGRAGHGHANTRENLSSSSRHASSAGNDVPVSLASPHNPNRTSNGSSARDYPSLASTNTIPSLNDLENLAGYRNDLSSVEGLSSLSSPPPRPLYASFTPNGLDMSFKYASNPLVSEPVEASAAPDWTWNVPNADESTEAEARSISALWQYILDHSILG